MDEADIYVNMDRPSVMGDTKPVKKSSYGAAAVILGLLCLLLLTGLTALIFLYTESTVEKVLLEASYNNLTEDRDELQINYNQLHERAEELAKREIDLSRKLEVEQSRRKWVYFRNSFYFISSTSESWHDSRRHCLQRGADLLVIDSEEEQEFARHFRSVVWIGLTDSATEGKWKWVDGTNLSTSFWGRNEPNDYGGDEDCGEIHFYKYKNNWNDAPCRWKKRWICERKVGP